MLNKFKKIKDTQAIQDIISFVALYEQSPEAFIEENPIFSMNGLDFLNFAETNRLYGGEQDFTINYRLSNEKSLGWNDLIELGLNEYMEENCVKVSNMYAELEEGRIIYDIEAIDCFLKLLENN